MIFGVQTGVTRRAADPALEAAFSSARRRAEAERWLGWLASQLPADELLTWWRIASLVPAERVLWVRRSLLVAVAFVVFSVTAVLAINGRNSAWWATAYGIIVVLYGYAELFHLNKIRKKRRKAAGPLAYPAPVVVTWRRLRRGEFGALVRSAVPLAGNLPLALVRSWTEPMVERPGVTAVGSLRADRRACVTYGLAWTPAGVLLGLLGGGPGAVPWPATLIVVLAQAFAAWLFGAVLGRAYPLLKFTEVTLGAMWWRGGLTGLLEDAADRGLVSRVGLGYAFNDAALHARLAAGYAEETRQRAQRLAAPRKREIAIANLTKPQIKRISIDVAITVGVAVLIAPKLPGGEGWSLPTDAASLGIGTVAAVISWHLARRLLPRLVAAARWTVRHLAVASRTARLRLALAAAILLALLTASAATGLASLLAAVLPTALVAACGGWACVVLHRKVRGRGRLLRLAPDAVAIAAADAALVVAFDKRLLTAQPAAGLLFPVALWGAIRLWNSMRSSERVAAKAAALVVFSLLLGGELVVFLVWLANVLGWSRAEVATVRAVLDWTGAHADLPWWAWTGLYAILLAIGLAFLRWPARLKKTAERFDRWQVGQVADVGGQLFTGVHVGLMAIVLVGVAAPVTVRPVLSSRLTAAYTVAYQRELADQGELAAYQAIIAAFSGQGAGTGKGATLARLVSGIHQLSNAGPGADHATGIELRLADRLAAEQAAALALPAPPAPPATGTGTGSAGQAGHGGGLPQAAGPAEKATATVAEQDAEDFAHKRVELVGDLAAKLLTSVFAIPQVSDNEVYQILREYLSALVEGSRIKEVFTAWAERLRGAKPPPAAGALVDPNPSQLKETTAADLKKELISLGNVTPGTDPGHSDPAWARAEREAPLAAALDMVNQARFIDDPTGTCVDCPSVLDIFTGRGIPGDEDPDIHLP
jgi:hypothetical protein